MSFAFGSGKFKLRTRVNRANRFTTRNQKNVNRDAELVPVLTEKRTG
jgi:hypothetical protein